MTRRLTSLPFFLLSKGYIQAQFPTSSPHISVLRIVFFPKALLTGVLTAPHSAAFQPVLPRVS